MNFGGLLHSNSPGNTISAEHNRQNRLRFVYTHFKSRDKSLDDISFQFFNTFRANAKSSMILTLPKSMVTSLEISIGKQILSMGERKQNNCYFIKRMRK